MGIEVLEAAKKAAWARAVARPEYQAKNDALDALVEAQADADTREKAYKAACRAWLATPERQAYAAADDAFQAAKRASKQT